ncbi:haloacid dehalogenase type II [Pelomonas sp. KK5]|uniref:haloacid dehalogenase type II n=1 Tax=Pelomonas sp. KK5 TaxID=1855730 RepID=UPI00097C6B81|nr:haloacid dehalogenase type II [Pelomonas sp. KK5]
MDTIRGIVFDLYGTLCDVHSVAQQCERFFPGQGQALSQRWRQKQLEYTWLRSLMDRYEDFEQVTEDGLVHSCEQLGLALDEARRRTLCEAYLRLSPFPEVPAALRALQDMGLPLAILSNGSPRSIDAVVEHAGLRERFAQLISADDAAVFKPDRRVYALVEQRLALDRSSILFVSSNAWDATGAGHFGFPTCWVNRRGDAFEQMGQRPTHEVRGLDELPAFLLDRAAAGH